MTTSTTIYLIMCYSPDNTGRAESTFFSKSKAYKYVAALTVANPTLRYIIEPIELKGD